MPPKRSRSASQAPEKLSKEAQRMRKAFKADINRRIAMELIAKDEPGRQRAHRNTVKEVFGKYKEAFPGHVDRTAVYRFKRQILSGQRPDVRTVGGDRPGNLSITTGAQSPVSTLTDEKPRHVSVDSTRNQGERPKNIPPMRKNDTEE